MAFGFRNRLAAFMMVTLIVVQGATAVTVYEVTRQALIGQSEHQLTESANLFSQQLDALSQRVAESVQVLSLDYPLRQAVASQNEQTVLSALRNHGRRVGATRMLWMGLDGTIQGDTANKDAIGKSFEFPDLLDEAASQGKARGVAMLDGKAYLIVLVPVMAPIPIAYIGANIPLDDAMVDRLRRLSELPPEVVLVTRKESGDWDVLAKAVAGQEILEQLLPDGAPPPPRKPLLVKRGTRSDIVLATPIDTRHSTPIVAVIGLSLDEALQPYDPVMLAALGLLLVGLVATLFGTGLIARSVARPAGIAGHRRPADRRRRLHSTRADRPDRRDRPTVRRAGQHGGGDRRARGAHPLPGPPRRRHQFTEPRRSDRTHRPRAQGAARHGGFAAADRRAAPAGDRQHAGP